MILAFGSLEIGARFIFASRLLDGECIKTGKTTYAYASPVRACGDIRTAVNARVVVQDEAPAPADDVQVDDVVQVSYEGRWEDFASVKDTSDRARAHAMVRERPDMFRVVRKGRDARVIIPAPEPAPTVEPEAPAPAPLGWDAIEADDAPEAAPSVVAPPEHDGHTAPGRHPSRALRIITDAPALVRWTHPDRWARLHRPAGAIRPDAVYSPGDAPPVRGMEPIDDFSRHALALLN